MIEKIQNKFFTPSYYVVVIIIKILRFFIKKVLFAGFLLYGYNLIATQFNMIVPINVYTLSIVSFLGSSGLVGLTLFKYLIL